MIYIVTDSTVYISRAEAEAMRVTVVPMTYNVDGRGTSFHETYIDENGAYEEIITQNMERMRTSQASYASFLSIFSDLLTDGHEILCLTLSSRMSGTYGNALMAAKSLNTNHIAVVDSLTTAAGLYLLVRRARALADAGRSLHETAAEVKALRANCRTFFSVDDMTPLRMSGRLSGVKLSVSTILNIKPVLRLADGSVAACGVARGSHEQTHMLVKAIGGYRGELTVQYFTPDTQAKASAARLSADGFDISMRKIGPVLAVHLGRGCVGVSWIE